MSDKNKNSKALYITKLIDENFIIYKDIKSDEMLCFIRYGKNKILQISQSNMNAKIAQYFLKVFNTTMFLSDTTKLVESALQYSQSIVRTLPKPISTNEDEIAFAHYSELNIPESEINCPAFDSLMNRCLHNKEALMCFFYLMTTEVRLQQYVHLQGDGGDGKSSLMSAFRAFFGEAVGNASLKDPRFALKFIGKRIGFMPDQSAVANVQSETFKNITGGEPTDIDIKNKDAVTIDLNVVIFLTSNQKPQISSERANLRRIIYDFIREPKENEYVPDLEAKLYKEMPHIIARCKQYLHLYNPITRKIKVSKESEEQIIGITADNEDKFLNFLDHYFEIDDIKTEDSKMTAKGSEVDILGTKFFKDANYVLNSCKKYMEREMKLTKKRVGKNKVTTWYGIKVKDKFQSEVHIEPGEKKWAMNKEWSN